jgi:phage anti-repressor protein
MMVDFHSIKRFIKTHSIIPNEFTDDFINLNSHNKLQTDMVLNLDVVSKWLNVRKSSLVKTLHETYKKGIDYNEIKSVKNTTYGGNNYKSVLLTPDCFKRLCMLSRSTNGELVRSYYLQIESLVFKYHEQTMRGMQLEIAELEKSIKPKKLEDHAGYIYVLRASKDKDSVYKLGRTKDLHARLKTYQTGRLEDVDIVYKFRTDNLKSMESCVKLALKERQYRKYKELYQADIQMIKEIIENCNGLENIKMHYKMRGKGKMDGGYYIGMYPDN